MMLWDHEYTCADHIKIAQGILHWSMKRPAMLQQYINFQLKKERAKD